MERPEHLVSRQAAAAVAVALVFVHGSLSAGFPPSIA